MIRTNEGENISRRGEGYVVHPSTVGTTELSADSSERQSVSPDRRFRPRMSAAYTTLPISDHHSLRVDALDERREYISLGVCCSGREEHVVRVPVDRENSRSQRLLDVLGYPPVVLLVKGTDGDGSAPVNTTSQPPTTITGSNIPSTTGNSKLVLFRRPLDTGCGSVDTEEHKRGLPSGSSMGPYIGITVLGASHNTVRVGCP
jgi:hypothetical protein